MRFGDVSDWITVVGSDSVEVAEGGNISLDIVSSGALVTLQGADGRWIVLSAGDGERTVSFGIRGGFTLCVEGAHAQAMTSIRLPRWRDLGVNWRNGDSFVQLDPKPVGVAPEIQAMLDQVNRNAAIREKLLRADFEKRLLAMQNKVPSAG